MKNSDDNNDNIILGLDTSANSIVQKTPPLLSLWSSPLTLSEFKILDAYMARIDSHHPERRWVQFTKGELEQLLGVEKINKEDLLRRIEHLGVMVKVEDLDDNKGFRSVALFEEAVCRQDDDGIWIVSLKCTTGAMKYIFNIDSIGYLRYKLQSVIHLSSRYSYLMFLYLERNRYRGAWDVSLKDLRTFLGCKEPTYDQFKFFNQFVLKRCKKELEANTPCKFEYSPIRRGRNTTGIHFVIAPLIPDNLPVSDAPTAKEYLDESSPGGDSSALSAREFILTACIPTGATVPEFSDAEMRNLLSLLPMVPAGKLPVIEVAGPARDYLQIQWYHYLSEKYSRMNHLAEKSNIKDRFAYLRKMIMEDIPNMNHLDNKKIF